MIFSSHPAVARVDNMLELSGFSAVFMNGGNRSAVVHYVAPMDRRDKSELEVAFRSFKISAKGLEAIRAVQWPVRLLVCAVAASILVVVWRTQPVYWLTAAASYIKSLF